jgi:beta-phosphoglucomutase-like phosphatase (HAD superfamily)
MSCSNTQNVLKDGFMFNEELLVARKVAGDGIYTVGLAGVEKVYATGDDNVEFICYENRSVVAYVKSKMGYPAMYPLLPARIQKPIKAVLMDLDGTSVRSEEFWIWIIEQTTARLLDNPKFMLESIDMPYVSGHSVSEHLKYCINKYCPDKTVEDARNYYFEITRYEMQEIVNGRGRKNAFKPTEGLKDFLYALKRKGIKIGLVTSGLYEKAWPEILDAFRLLDMGDPCKFYDAIISAGYPFGSGQPGTLGELEPKPHPWLYAETARVGLGIDFAHRHQVVGIEDSGAGVVSIRLAGFAAIGIADGNILGSKTEGLCSGFFRDFNSILKFIE